ncbi:MAG: hypothetical protein H0X25_12645, partial [Acidobacteriales bacterium]|nr:hypothetical protein [Terriglobales bacterium]
IRIIRALANGMDPESGVGLEAGSLLQRREIIVALNRALSALAQTQEREESQPKNAGKSWSREEDTEICNELCRGMTLAQIAGLHHRSTGSIVVRLVKLGKISPAKAAHSTK